MSRKISRWLEAHALAASLLVLVCSATVRGSMAARNDASVLLSLHSDGPTYLTPAHSLVEHHAFLDADGKPMFHRTPGYPAFLAALMLLTGPDLWTVLMAQALILSCGPLLLYWLARRLLPPLPALVAGLVSVASPWGAVLAGLPLSDGLFVFLLCAVFLLIKLTVDHRDARQSMAMAIAAGVLTGWAVLVRPITPLVVMVPMALLMSFPLRNFRAWLLVAISVVGAVTPPALWLVRNHVEARFDGLSDIVSQTAWEYLAARVRADVTGQDRHAMSEVAAKEQASWAIPPHSQRLDNERWKRAMTIFQEHPLPTVTAFSSSALEHTLHPSPDVLTPARLHFPRDTIVLGLSWGILLLLSAFALWDAARRWVFGSDSSARLLVTMFVVCMLLTLSSGLSFAAGSRLRAPLEAVIPMLAAAGLFRSAWTWREAPRTSRHEPV